MKETKYSKIKLSSSFNGMLRSPKNTLRSPKSKGWTKMSWNVGLIVLAGVSALVLMMYRENIKGSVGIIDDFSRMFSPAVDELQQQWNYRFQPNVSDWDEQRANWTTEHPNFRPLQARRPRVMMVTGSSPEPCEHAILCHLLLRSGKNKLAYSQIHDMELYYNMGDPDPEFNDSWMKLPVIRMLMLQHPEVEWIWWLDSNAILTDMSFEPPFAELDRHNLVLYGEDRLVYSSKDWTGLSTSNFMIRNTQWALDLLDAWAWASSVKEESGRFQRELYMSANSWPIDIPGDDQSSLITLLAQDKKMRIGKQRWAPMVKLVKETEFAMNANWSIVGPKLEELGLLDDNKRQSVPFVTHFEGCLPSVTAKPMLSGQALNACMVHIERAFDFADNQVYKQLGFLPRNLSSSLEPLKNRWSDETGDAEKEFSILPTITDWDERRQAWMKKFPPSKRDEVILVSGSAPKPCIGKVGTHMLVRGLKNLIDYGRTNDLRIFYNNAVVDKNLIGWWSKLPLLKTLMVNNPSVEWIWWLDSDAPFTDMDFILPFARYNAEGYNVAMYGSTPDVFEKKSYRGINTGNFLIRNCQWSLDLLDRWGSFGATREIRVKNEHLLNSFLSDRPPGWVADDQCVLVYLLITEREKWATQVLLENVITMSGSWQYWSERFDGAMASDYKPFVTHFAGCKPCQEIINEDCMIAMDRTYNFADNQVVAKYGLRHESLNSSVLQKLSQLVSNVSLVEGEDMGIDKAKDFTEGASEGHTLQEVDSPKDEKVNISKEEPAESKDTVIQSKEAVDRGKKELEVPKEES